MSKKENLHLLLLPGLACDARLWQHQLAALTDRAQMSVADLSVADSIPALASAVLSAAPSRHFALAGLSMGGYVALEIMRQAPERVLALALLDTSAQADSAEARAARQKAMLAAESDLTAVMKGLLPKLLHPAHQQDALAVDTIFSMASSLGKEVFLRQQTAILGRIDSRPSLPQIKCPTLVLCGREDLITPLALHDELVTGIPGSMLEVVDECGHLSALDQGASVSAALGRWLDDVKWQLGAEADRSQAWRG
jgi:pimeloyl-ACP methyl ester carboxylesterase